MMLALLCVAQILLPGLAGAVLLTTVPATGSPTGSSPRSPGDLGSGRLLARGLACGISAWLLMSGLLAGTVGLSSTSVAVAAMGTAIASLAALALPRSRDVLRRALPDVAYLGALLLAALVTWWPVGLLVLRTTWGPLGSTPWYYGGLAHQVADSGGVPATSKEFGTTLPFLADYRFFSTGTAMLLDAGESGAQHALQVVTVIAVVLLACGAALLANAWGAGRLASLAAVPLAVGTGIGALRLYSYRPEGFALGLTLLVAALCVDRLRTGHRGSLTAACLLIATLAQVHGLALLTAGVLLLGALAALWPRHRPVPFLRRAAITGGALAASVLLVSLVAGGASGTEHTGSLGDEHGLADPTWEFIRAISALPPSQPPGNAEIASSTVTAIYHGTGWWLGPLVAGATVLLVVTAVHHQRGRRLLVFTLVSLAALAAVAAVFAFGWSSYVPRRTGAQRLLTEASLLVGPYVAGALGCVPLVLGRRAWWRPVTAVTVIVLCAGGLLASAHLEHTFTRMRPPQAAVEALSRLDLPAGSVVLTNAYTEGFLADVMSADGLLEGRAPYTYPDVLRRANRLLRGAHTFFDAPCSHGAFLRTNHVDYIVVARRGSYALASANTIAGASDARLHRCPRLRPLLTTADLRVYRVNR
jgi:hypothetical protein